MGLLGARQAKMAEVVVSWSRLRSRIAMIDSSALARGVIAQRTTRSGRLAVMGLHRGYMVRRSPGLLLHQRGRLMLKLPSGVRVSGVQESSGVTGAPMGGHWECAAVSLTAVFGQMNGSRRAAQPERDFCGRHLMTLLDCTGCNLRDRGFYKANP
jgi:hypothetical protein